MKHRHWPITFLVFTVLGVVSMLIGVAALAGIGGSLHPLLADEGAGIAMIVTAIALVLTGGFPLVLRRLAEREGA
jgi:fructose-specific phosphotransferase system IIC component